MCQQHHVGVHRNGWSTRWEHRRGRRVLVVVAPDGSTVEPPDPPTGPPPEPPPPGQRHTGTCEPLTFYARDVLLTSWMLADQPPEHPEDTDVDAETDDVDETVGQHPAIDPASAPHAA